MQFAIKNRFTGAIQFECEITAEIAGQSYGLQLGFAVKKAFEAHANLAGAYLADANLAGAYLAGANLAGANLAHANLAHANLAHAYLADANLADANLADANLLHANLAGANLADANGKKLTLVGQRPVLQMGPLGSRCAQLSAYLTVEGVYVRTGCFFGSLERFREAVRDAHGAMGLHAEEYAAAIVMIERYARLWTPAKAESEAA